MKIKVGHIQKLTFHTQDISCILTQKNLGHTIRDEKLNKSGKYKIDEQLYKPKCNQ